MSTQRKSDRISDAALSRFVETALARRPETNSALCRLERTPSAYCSSFAIEVLTAHFDDGSQLELMFKDLSWNGLLERARRIRPPFAYEASREIRVYREILPVARLGTACCFGALIDPGRQRYWLLLEKVQGEPLCNIGDFSLWCAVARWLANMHVQLAEAAVHHQRNGWIPACDESYWNAWIGRAEHLACQNKHSELSRLTAGQRNWLSQCARRAARRLSCLPSTLVHGEFYASNILVRDCGGRTRICPIDWETAAVGPGVIDLAALVGGRWAEPQREELARNYFESLSAQQASCGELEELLISLRCGRLLLAIKWLAFAASWQPPAEHHHDWLAEAMQLAAGVDSLKTRHLSTCDL